jgi:hypothetical protein
MKCNKRNKCNHLECVHAKDHDVLKICKYMTWEIETECDNESYCDLINDYRKCSKKFKK